MSRRPSTLPRPPAVFVFDPASNQLVSKNASAGELLAVLGWGNDEMPTLSTVERLLLQDSKVTVAPQTVVDGGERNYELRKRCRRPDSSEFTLTRIWTPGSSTTLIVTDITASVQEERQLRFAQTLIDRLMKSDSLTTALGRMLHAVLLYSGWRQGAAWIVKEEGLSLRKTLVRSGTEIGPAEKSGAERELAERCWQSGETETRHDKTSGTIAIALKANGDVIAVLTFATLRMQPRDKLTLEVLGRIADHVGMALKCRINAEETASARRQLDELLDAAGDAIVAMDRERVIRIFNKRAEAIFGYSAEEIIGKKMDVLLPQSVRARHRTHVARFTRGDAPTKLMGHRPEVKGRRKDGSEFPAEASISRITIDGEMIFTAVVRDLTVLRRAEETLRARELQMRMVIETMPFGIAVALRTTGEILFVNSAFGALVDADRRKLSGRHIAEFAGAALSARLLAGEGADSRLDGIEAPFTTEAGDEIWCMVSAVAMSMGGEQLTLIGCHDVTDRYRAEEALRRSAANLAAAERIAHLGNWQLNVSTMEISCSDAALRILGGNSEDGKTTLQHVLGQVHPADEPVLRLAARTAIEQGTPFRITHRISTPTGEMRYVRCEAEAIRGRNGEIEQVIGTVLDITDLQKVTEELRTARNKAEYANHAKSQFLANMSHELRTPLNAIIGFSELMATDVMGPMETAQYQAYAKDIHDSGLHLLAVVNDILDLSRIEVGVTELEEAEIDIEDIYHFCKRTVEGRAKAAKLALIQQSAPNLPKLKADLRLTRQILLNLLSNAVKFTPAGGTVCLGAEIAADGALVLSVEDTGIGIAAENIERVTEPFMQVESHLSRRFDGVGLGLALTKQFAELHGAKFSIMSAEGKGTRVEVAFPASRTLTTDEPHLSAVGM